MKPFEVRVPVKVLSSKQRGLAVAMVLLLLFVLRPGASRLKSRIIAAISSGVGRAVDIGSVHLRLLPRPGFDLENLVVYDDPAFGAEPMLRAGEVTAALRLTSLARGKLEIARLDLSEPSLNLVRGTDGRWNAETLLERSAHTPLAPTAKAKSEPRPGFPYIEATSARINFKSGTEKKPYALSNADFSLWQDSENAWGVRLKAQPIRGDLNLNDMGLLRVNGSWQRAATLRDTPLAFSMEWNRAQLGQLTKFFTGSDQGWRGGVQLEVKLTGTPATLAVASDVGIEDFRRYDITTGEALALAAHCDGQYQAADATFHEVLCSAPVGNGVITLKGDAGVPGTHRYALAVSAENVPLGAAVALAQRTKKNLPDDLTGAGLLRGTVTIDGNATAKLRLEGRGEIAEFRLASVANRVEVGPELIPFAFVSGGEPAYRRANARKDSLAMGFPAAPHFEMGPFALAMGRTAAPMARGWIDRSGYTFGVAGEAEVGRMLRLARILGLPALNSAADGDALLDLKISGTWPGWGYRTHANFVGPQITGAATLRNVRAAVRGAGGTVEILSADAQLAADEVRVEKLRATAANTLWTGSLRMPRGCGAPGACEVRFNLSADRIALNELAEWTSPRPKQRPWYRVLDATPPTGPSVVASLRAKGRVTADRFLMHGFTANHASANLSLDHAKLEISDLNADVLGGKHRGEWRADFAAKPAVCSGSGTFSGLVLAQLAERMHDRGLAGTGKISYELAGPCAAEFWPTAQGALTFEVRDGVLPQISLPDEEGPLAIARLAGRARVHEGRIEIKDAALDSPRGRFQLSGTASFKQELDLKLVRGPANTAVGFTITGTLAEPRVRPLAGSEQARLKP